MLLPSPYRDSGNIWVKRDILRFKNDYIKLSAVLVRKCLQILSKNVQPQSLKRTLSIQGRRTGYGRSACTVPDVFHKMPLIGSLKF